MPIFSPADTLGAMAPAQIADYLAEIGDFDGETRYRNAAAAGQAALFNKDAYSHTGMVIGFVAPNAAQGKTCPVESATQLAADTALIQTRIKISLDKFFVSSYPGYGQHTILCEYSGKNQALTEAEDLRFALRFNAHDNASAALNGVPIFLGLTVGPDGISFTGSSVCVRSAVNDEVLAAFDNPVFKSGLTLLNTAQPALKPLSTLAIAAVKWTANRGKNKVIHTFDIGLDFGGGATSARLRHGSYIVVQTDDAGAWDWKNFEWNRDAMGLQYKGEPGREITFNYSVYGVSAFVG